MKKLMLTTALASTLITSGAIAQTTITGELRINYKSLEMKKGETNLGTFNNNEGFGAEQQINIQTKGKLNVGGLDYAAGFSIENDGEQQTTLFNENVYMDLTNASSGTTISFGRDHIQRSDSDFSATNLVGFNQAELSAKGSSTNASNTYGGTHFLSTIGAGPSQSYGAAVVQKFPIGTFSYNFVPSNGQVAPTAGYTNGLSTVGNSEYVNENNTSAYEYGFLGDLGVKGLQVHYFKNANSDIVNKSATASLNGVIKAEGKNYGIKYNFGEFTVAANQKIHQPESRALTYSTGVGEITEKAFAASYAVNKDLSVGVLYAKAQRDANTSESNATITSYGGTQKLKAINIGYNLGPVALAAAYATNENVQGKAGADDKQYMVRLIGAMREV